MNSMFWQGKRVLITGHTGFKGSWLCEWLLQSGALVTGYALPPPTDPSMFDQIGLKSRINHIEGDVRNLTLLRHVITETCPDFVFHLAAQPLVRLSYDQPVDTYSTNIMGTVNVLEAIRLAARPCVVVVVTTDKCYENKEWLYGYREEDPMGGHDPYSSSKGAAELVVDAYRRSYFSNPNLGISVASARAGNVIGGGDWALDRIVPDCVRALQNDEPIFIRNKFSTRPWQHVLEPLSGYLSLAIALSQRSELHGEPFNFGPQAQQNHSVLELVQKMALHWDQVRWKDVSKSEAGPHEAALLKLNCDKSLHYLQWNAVMGFEQTVQLTSEWYDEYFKRPNRVAGITNSQIEIYTELAKREGLSWAQ